MSKITNARFSVRSNERHAGSPSSVEDQGSRRRGPGRRRQLTVTCQQDRNDGYRVDRLVQAGPRTAAAIERPLRVIGSEARINPKQIYRKDSARLRHRATTPRHRRGHPRPILNGDGQRRPSLRPNPGSSHAISRTLACTSAESMPPRSSSLVTISVAASPPPPSTPLAAYHAIFPAQARAYCGLESIPKCSQM